jgi:hypothetical protein
MSNWDYASEDELEAGREAYSLDDPKHPDYTETYHTPMYEEEPVGTTITPDVNTVAAMQKASIRAREKAMETTIPAHSQEIVLFSGDPAEKRRQMEETAQIIAEPVRQRHTVKIGQGEHVRVEGWTMLGALLGVYPIVVWTKPIYGRDDDPTQPFGWEARVEARTRQGQLVGAAEAECLRSEANWKGRDDYALRSMAQTRATSKALRQPLGYVITLAGFDATPAEEMPNSAFQPPTVDEKRRLMFSLRDRLARAGKLDKETFVAQVQDDYGKHPGRLTSEETTEVIDRLTKALEKHHERSS